MSKSDQKFFRQFQHRTYRVRLSYPDEVDEFAAATGLDMTAQTWLPLVHLRQEDRKRAPGQSVRAELR